MGLIRHVIRGPPFLAYAKKWCIKPRKPHYARNQGAISIDLSVLTIFVRLAMTNVRKETMSSSSFARSEIKILNYEEDAVSYHSIFDQQVNIVPFEERGPATPSRQSIYSGTSKVSRIQSTHSETSRVSRIQSIHSTNSRITIKPPSSNSKKSELSVGHLKSKIACRVQYIGFSLISMGCAFAVMIIWYTVWLDKNKTPDATKSTKNATNANGTCPVWDLAGDGYCDDDANIPECGYDFSDCCELENDRSACQNCTCFVSANKIENFKEKNCLDYLDLTHLGDGTCDLNYNKAEYFFDIGDCCQQLTGEQNSEYKCQDKVLNWGLIPDQDQDFIVRDCPEDPCIQSNNFCIPEELGDGICQDHNNGPYCDYDMGDCCMVEVIKDECCNCACSTFDSPLFYSLGRRR